MNYMCNRALPQQFHFNTVLQWNPRQIEGHAYTVADTIGFVSVVSIVPIYRHYIIGVVMIIVLINLLLSHAGTQEKQAISEPSNTLGE